MNQPTSRIASLQQEYNFSPKTMPMETTETTTVIRETTAPICNHEAGGFSRGWMYFGLLLVWFILFLVVFWLIFYSLHPTFVLVPGTQVIDTAKVLLYAFIAAIILIIIIWIIRAVTHRSGRKY